MPYFESLGFSGQAEPLLALMTMRPAHADRCLNLADGAIEHYEAWRALLSQLTTIDVRQRDGWRHTGPAFGLLPDLLSPSGLFFLLLVKSRLVLRRTLLMMCGRGSGTFLSLSRQISNAPIAARDQSVTSNVPIGRCVLQPLSCSALGQCLTLLNFKVLINFQIKTCYRVARDPVRVKGIAS